MIDDRKKFVTIPKLDYDEEQKELANLRSWKSENEFTISIHQHSGSMGYAYTRVYAYGKIPDGRIPSEIKDAIEILQDKIQKLNSSEESKRKREDDIFEREKAIRESALVPKWIRWFFQ